MKCSQTTLNYASPPTDYDSLVLSLQKCTADIKDWMLENKLKLNDGKTEAIRFSPPSFGLAHSLSTSIFPGTCNIQFTQEVRDLSLMLDSELTIKNNMSLKSAKHPILNLNVLVSFANIFSPHRHLQLNHSASTNTKTLLHISFLDHKEPSTAHLCCTNSTGCS